MSRFELILLLLCLGACSTPPPPVDPLTLAGLNGAGYRLITTRDGFQRDVVGQSLSGSGYRAQVLPGGTLTGLYVGQVFNGVWTFSEEAQYCQSLTATLSGPTYSCFWVAVKDDDIRLIPVPEGR